MALRQVFLVLHVRSWMVSLLLAIPSAWAQDTPQEVYQTASKMLSLGNYLDAIPPLNQLVTWFADSQESRIISMMESVYFNLGMAHFLCGHFSEAETVFDTYLRKYRHGPRAWQAAAYRGDAFRFQTQYAKALKAYQDALSTYTYGPDWRADILIGMAKCHLAEERWAQAAPLLLDVYRTAPDFQRRNWAASLLAVSYLKDLRVEPVYDMMPYLLHPKSYASYSVALNLALLEAGDALFEDEKYRDSLWIYRVVYPHDVITIRATEYKEELVKSVSRLRREPGQIRKLIRLQEEIGQIEQELKALDEIPNYDAELGYRIARGYQEIQRYREARELFHHLYETEIPDRMEECLYLSFFCAAQVQPWQQAVSIGREYMTVYPAGEYYDTVSLTVGQIYAQQQNWPQVIQTLTNALDVSPQHADIVECLYLLGYAYFMEEQFSNAVASLVRMNRDYPGNDREVEGSYWIGMSFLFDRQYDEARPYFDHVVLFFPNSSYAEDAAFRSATCDYGLSLFERAEDKMRRFLDRYPGTRLAGEAHLILGDIAGARGQLGRAVEEYQQALALELNIEHYNFAAFRAGEILFRDLKDYHGVIAHFERYRERAREGSNIPQALYWEGNAWWQLGEKERALLFYRKAMAEYGHDREALGVDLILDEWAGKLRDAPPDLAALGWREARDLLRTSLARTNLVLALRLQRLLLYDPKTTEADRAAIMNNLRNPQNLALASPAILELLLDEAQQRNDRDTEALVAERIVADFPETDYALSARMVLARHGEDAQDFEAAIRHLTVVREVFASSPEAAEALLQLGRIYLKAKRYDEADQAYNDVLAAREWRPLWPQALYGRGEVALQRRDYSKAAAYFERIYVLYTAHREWAAKAYLARAEALLRLRERKKAMETLEEFLALPEFSDRPETEEARTLLTRIREML